MAGGMSGGYGTGPMAPPPVAPRKNGANGCLIGGLVGCGVLVIIVVVVAYISANAFKNASAKGGGGGFGAVFKNAAIGPQLAGQMTPVSRAFEGYKKDHGGKYPAALSDLAPKYLTDKSVLAKIKESGDFEYTPPKSDAPADAIVFSVHTGDASLVATQTTLFYVRILRDGSIVQDQITRTQYFGGSKTKGSE